MRELQALDVLVNENDVNGVRLLQLSKSKVKDIYFRAVGLCSFDVGLSRSFTLSRVGKSSFNHEYFTSVVLFFWSSFFLSTYCRS